MRPRRPLGSPESELLQILLFAFTNHFHRTVPKVSDIALQSEAGRLALGVVSETHTLDPAPDYELAGGGHGINLPGRY
jgi:hypothetical protein